MTPQAVFYQACPVCGRSIRMPVQYFGRAVTCVHCGGEFRADDHSAAVSSAQSAGFSAVGTRALPGLLPMGIIPLGSLPSADAR